MKKYILTIVFLASYVGSHTLAQNVREYPLIYKPNFANNYLGAFRISEDDNGVGRTHNVEGGISYHRMEDGTETFFVTGERANRSDPSSPFVPAVAQYRFPGLSTSMDHNQLPRTSAPLQQYTAIYTTEEDHFNWPGQCIPTASGMLICEARAYYPASGLDKQGLVRFSKKDALECGKDTFMRVNAESGVEAPGDSEYSAREAAGWMVPLDDEWASVLGCTTLTGPSDGWNTEGQNHIGPTVFCFNPDEQASEVYSSTPLMDHSSTDPFTLIGEAGEGLINAGHIKWASMSNIQGCAIPSGTRSLFCTGNHFGVIDDIGYKITQDTGPGGIRTCGGPCTFQFQDAYNYYWIVDMNDILDARNELRRFDSIEPYAYGGFTPRWQENTRIRPDGDRDNAINLIRGMTFDKDTNRIFINVANADPDGNYTYRPVVEAYTFDTSPVSVPPVPSDVSVSGASMTGNVLTVTADPCGPPGLSPVQFSRTDTTHTLRVFLENNALQNSNTKRGMRAVYTLEPGENMLPLNLAAGSYTATLHNISAEGVQSH